MKTPALVLYYDGLCPLCAREINHYRHCVTDGRVHFVDITAPDFDAPARGLNLQAVHRTLHSQLLDGRVLTGVDTFIALWQIVPGYRVLAWLTSLPLLNTLARGAYALFVPLRQLLPKLQQRCADDRCAV
jgi:predicted DCC family thiol-disulfide oxidoreductase YuxK